MIGDHSGLFCFVKEIVMSNVLQMSIKVRVNTHVCKEDLLPPCLKNPFFFLAPIPSVNSKSHHLSNHSSYYYILKNNALIEIH